MEIKKVGVVGCGAMGGGIVEVCARAGYPVVVSEINQGFLDKGMGAIKSRLDRAIKKGRLAQEEEDAILGRIKGTTDNDDFADCDIVIEAIIEDLDAKKELFISLDEICPKHTILASNTSSLPITDMAAATKRIERVVGLHFFNPVPVMKLAEIIPNPFTDEDVTSSTKAFAESIGKTAVMAKDTPGFIVNRIIVAATREAFKLEEMGISKEDIDAAMELGANWPMGPFKLLDLLGIDITYHMWSALYDEFKDPVWAPPLLLKQMFLAGRYGRKTGKGFYDYGK
jgi:3-hydroxybutyryl-CoA dehydrogenase